MSTKSSLRRRSGSVFSPAQIEAGGFRRCRSQAEIAQRRWSRSSQPLAGSRIACARREESLWVRAAFGRRQEALADSMAIFHVEVERILEDPGVRAAKERLFYRSDPETQRLSELIVAADKAFDHAFEALQSWFGFHLPSSSTC